MNKRKTLNKREPLRRGKIFVLSGPSGSGKTTLHERLLSDRRVKQILVKTISATTRKPRPKEKYGRDYFFLSRKQFLDRVRRGCFLEWQKVFCDYYGTPRKPVEKVLRTGQNVLLCIDVQGARTVFRRCPKAVGIFLRTSRFAVLKKRLLSRGSEDQKQMAQRLRVARQELSEASRYGYVVINDVLSCALKRLKEIILKESV